MKSSVSAKKSKGDHAMKEINIGQATALTSPDPLVLVCTKKEDGKLKMAPVICRDFSPFHSVHDLLQLKKA